MLTMSKAEAGKKIDEDPKNGKLMQDIETISKALYLDKCPSKTSTSTASSRSKSLGKTQSFEPNSKSNHSRDDPPAKDKKSFWKWKPLKALSQVRNRRFNCCFTLQVHTIVGLPSSFNNGSLSVHWKRRDGELATSPAKVIEGIAEFEEQLALTCSVYGSRSGPNHTAKYEAKHFLLYAVFCGKPELDLGKHRVDLTRVLPLTWEELEDEKNTGKWTTSFKLSGKAKGAMMNVSFGYLVIGDNIVPPPNNKNVLELLTSKPNSTTGTRDSRKGGHVDRKVNMPNTKKIPKDQRSTAASQSMDDIKVLHEVLPVKKSALSDSLRTLEQMFEEDKSDHSVDKSEISVFTDHTEHVKTSSVSRLDSSKENVVNDSEDGEFSFPKQGAELSPDGMLQEDVIEVADGHISENHDTAKAHSEFEANPQQAADTGPEDADTDNTRGEFVAHNSEFQKKDVITKELLLKELDSALNSVADLESAGLETPDAKSKSGDSENSDDDSCRIVVPGLDDVAESVASEFLSMMGMEDSPMCWSPEGEPLSPREQLLRDFEKEALSHGYSLFDFDDFSENGTECDYNAPHVSGLEYASEDFQLLSSCQDDEEHQFEDFADDSMLRAKVVEEMSMPRAIVSGWEDFSEDFELPSDVDTAEEHQVDSQGETNMPRAKVLEGLETEALMRELGLSEKAFQSSPPKGTAGFDRPVDNPPEAALQPPPLGEGLGPFVQTKNGGFVRSMNPTLFDDAKSGGSLIMQVSNPVVVPAEMGSGVMEILECLASVGLEKLSMQASKLMPLEDIRGKTIQQIAWEAVPKLEAHDKQDSMQHEKETRELTSCGKKRNKGRSSRLKSDKHSSSSGGDGLASEYVSLEDLAPLAMDKIEALSIEGLKIQSDMSNEEAPNANQKSIGHSSVGLEGAVGLQLLDVKENGDAVDGLMGLSITLEEWMMLDSGEIDEEQISERTSKILAAHHATCTDLSVVGKKGAKKRAKGRRYGLLGNNLTVALMVQLRDPLRDYEPVGTPMLALIQVERVFVPPKPRIYRTVSEVKSCDEDDEPEVTGKSETKEEAEEKIPEEELIPQYKIAEVHVAGLKTEPGKKKLWGTSAQQQSGSRWLLANGMGKNKQHSVLKAKVVSRTSPMTTTTQPGDTLWSISARVHGTGVKWKELAALNPHIRNPNVVIPNDSVIKLR